MHEVTDDQPTEQATRAVYPLPETTDPAQDGVKHPGAAVDGYLMEFKTITGSINQIEHRFRESRKKEELETSISDSLFWRSAHYPLCYSTF
jgi:hypothetical protein